MPVSSRSLKHAFSLNKQTSIITADAVIDANISKLRGTIEFAPYTKNREASVHDQGFFGTGSNFASFNELLQKSFLIASSTRPASDLDLIWMLAYSMGGHAVVQDDPVGEPNQWNHTITFADIATSPEVDYTSVLEQMGTGATPGHKFKGIGVWLASTQIQAAFGDFVRASFTGGIRNLVTSAASLPSAITTAALFNINRTTLAFGAVGGPVNIDGRWVSFDLTFAQNPAMKFRSGQVVTEEELIERVDRGDQTVTGNLTVELRDTERNFYLNETAAAVTIELISKTIITGGSSVPVKCTITIPEMIITGESFSEEDRTTLLELEISEQSVLKTGAGQPVTIVIDSENVDNTEIFV